MRDAVPIFVANLEGLGPSDELSEGILSLQNAVQENFTHITTPVLLETTCIFGLGELGATGEVALVTRFLESPDLHHRMAAAWSLARLGHGPAAMKLAQILDDPLQILEFPVRLWALGEPEDPQTAPAIRRAARHLRTVKGEQARHSLAMAVRALRKMPRDPETEALLEEITRDRETPGLVKSFLSTSGSGRILVYLPACMPFLQTGIMVGSGTEVTIEAQGEWKHEGARWRDARSAHLAGEKSKLRLHAFLGERPLSELKRGIPHDPPDDALRELVFYSNEQGPMGHVQPPDCVTGMVRIRVISPR